MIDTFNFSFVEKKCLEEHIIEKQKNELSYNFTCK